MTILIIEDEPRTASLLKEFIMGHRPSFVILPVIDSVEGSVSYLNNCAKQPGLIFMDIQLSDGLSFDIFNRVKVTSPVIFCTAFEDFTLQAFKSNGVEYILKPFAEIDIFRALEKIDSLKKALVTINVINSERTIKEFLLRKPLSHFLINFREKMYPVNAGNVAAFYINAEKVYLITFNGDKYPLNRKIEEVEELVDPAVFFRISRQMIINRNAIENIEQYFNRKLFIKLKIESPLKPIVSRLKVGAFIKWIENR